MFSRRSARTVAAALIAITTLFGSVPGVRADGVDDQRRKVQQIADQLDAIANRVGQLDEDYGAALDRQAQLAIEIADSQAKVDAQQAQLGELQGKLSDIAIDKFVSGGALDLSPLFSTAAAYTEAQQRDQLSRLALDNGSGDTDDLEALISDLATERAALDRKNNEASDLIVYLDAKRAEATQLEADYKQQYAAAQAELGDAIQQEQERRAAAAVAAAQQQFDQSNGNGGGGGDAGNSSPGRGGGDTGGSDTGGGAAAPPPPSGMAGMAIAAAYSQLGVSYKFAAESPGVAFDCSGLTKYAWGRAGVYLPHQSRAQYAATPRVPKDQAQAGDLIYYYSPIGHVGIYLGNGMMIHAPQTGDVVKISTVHWGKVVGVSRPG